MPAFDEKCNRKIQNLEKIKKHQEKQKAWRVPQEPRVYLLDLMV